MTTKPTIEGFFDPDTWTVSYVVGDRVTRRAAAIDPVLDDDAKAGRTSARSAERLLAYVPDNALQVD